MKVQFEGTLEGMNLNFDFKRKGTTPDYTVSSMYPETTNVDGCVLRLKVINGKMNINNVNDLDALQSKKVLVTVEIVE